MRRFFAANLAALAAVFTLFVATPGASAQGNPLVSALAGKLLDGVGSGAGSAVVGALISNIGLDPTTNALNQISQQLEALKQQITALQATADKTLATILSSTFDIRLDNLKITTIEKLEDDYDCWLDKSKTQTQRDACRAHFKAQASPVELTQIINTFNDLLDSRGTTIAQAYAQKLVGAGRFYTQANQKQVTDFYTYLDSLQVAAVLFYAEAVNGDAAGKSQADQEAAMATAQREVDFLRQHRAKQLARNPVDALPGALSVEQRLWINPQAKGMLTYGEASDFGRWHLPSLEELSVMVQARGNKTVKAYLSQDAGLADGLKDVAEYGDTGEFWTSTACPKLTLFINLCQFAVSTNDAQVRFHSPSQRFYSIYVSPLDATELSHYSFLWG